MNYDTLVNGVLMLNYDRLERFFQILDQLCQEQQEEDQNK